MPAAPTSSSSISKASASRRGSARSPTRRRAPGKPLIVAKVGRSDAGRRAAASHTGALAHAGAVDDAIFRHHGIIRGEDLDHMVDVATAFAYLQAAARATGSRSSPARAAARCGWPTSCRRTGSNCRCSKTTSRRKIMAMLPSYASALNPIDATAQAIGEVGYAPIVELVRAVAADRHDPPDRLARQRDTAPKARRGAGRHRRRRPSSRSCCRPTRPRRRARSPPSPRPASPATPRCRAAPARSRRSSITAAFRERIARRAAPTRDRRRRCATRSRAGAGRVGHGADRGRRRRHCSPPTA